MTDTTRIRPFQVNVSNEDLTELERRIAATRWPHRELVDDRSQGVQLATMQELARYWENDYDWRRCEADHGHLDAERDMARRAGSRIVEIDGGSHAVAVSQPRTVAEVIPLAVKGSC